MGFQVMTGMEFEWFNFLETPESWAAKKGVAPQTLTPGMFGYSLLRMNQHRDFLNALMDQMLTFKVPIEGLHTETGPGVYEVAIGFSEAMEQADRAILFKTGAKEIGARFGIDWIVLAEANDIPGPDYFVRAGQVLTIPPRGGATGTAPAPTAAWLPK